MLNLHITLDAVRIGKDDFAEIFRDGEIISAEGVINARWEEFSALDLAREVNLQSVKWESSADDSPSSLTIVAEFSGLIKEDLERRFSHIPGIENYQINVEEMALV